MKTISVKHIELSACMRLQQWETMSMNGLTLPHYGFVAVYPIPGQHIALHNLLTASHNVLGNLVNLLLSQIDLNL